MFVYCRNNPVSRADASGRLDYECDEADSVIDEDEIARWSCGGLAIADSSGSKAGNSSSMPIHGADSTSDFNGESGVSAPIDIPLPTNPLASITYTDKVIQDMGKADFHGFPNIVDNYGNGRYPSQIMGGDGNLYYRLAIAGYYKGYFGEFVYIWDQQGMCNHRCFEAR